MWWLIIPAAIVVVKLVYDAVSETEIEYRDRWERKREQVERSIQEHRENIERHVEEARSSYDFHFLCDLHYSSMHVGNEAYQLYKDAGSSIAGMTKMLMEANEQRTSLRAKLAEERKVGDGGAIGDTVEQLKIVRKLRRNLRDDRKKVIEQREAFYEEVRRLNHRTHGLKEAIRDKCGERGRSWYERLEERSRVRRLQELDD